MQSQTLPSYAPVSELSVDARSNFIWRTYGHVAAAILLFAGIETYLFSTGIALPMAQSMLQMNWLLILGSAGGIRDRYSRLAAGGIAMYFAAHFMINVSVNLGLIPMTGITLPLFSTGGSSLMTTFLALGLAVGLAAHSEPALDKDAFSA